MARQRRMSMRKMAKRTCPIAATLMVLNAVFWRVGTKRMWGMNLDGRCPSSLTAIPVNAWRMPRVIFYGEDNFTVYTNSSGRQVDQLSAPRVRRAHDPPVSGYDEAIAPPIRVHFHPQLDSGGSYNMSRKAEKRCVAMSEWQSQSFPACNTMHESNFVDDIEAHLNKGEYRDVWKVNIGPDSFALKTLRLNNGKLFSPQRAEQNRLDAVASERLTASPYVAGIYGYCGQSTLNGLGASTGFFLLSNDLSGKQKLKFALGAARGLAAAHGIDGGQVASLVHRDVKGPNYLVSANGESFMLHDFNGARFMRWDDETKKSCAFDKPECNQHRSPEECKGEPLTEKIDVYSLGHVFYAILTNYAPYRYPENITALEWNSMIVNGTTPELPRHVENSTDPAISAIIDAMNRCYTYDHLKRPRAREIAFDLGKALESFDVMGALEFKQYLSGGLYS